MQDIHDIRPPVMTGTDPALVKMALIAAALLLGGAVLVLLFRYFRKRRKKGQVPELIPSVPPLTGPGQTWTGWPGIPFMIPGAFYFELARITKTYLGGVFGVNCLEMTTPELVQTLKGLGLSIELKREIALFQEVSDPFRYGPAAPPPEQLRGDLDRARALVAQIDRATAPEPGSDKDGGAAPEPGPENGQSAVPKSLPGPGGAS